MEYDIEQIEKQNEKRKRTKQIVKKLLFYFYTTYFL